MTSLNLSADEVLTTTRSVRKRLDFDKPVERAVVEECLNIAMQAPTGSNHQGWHWVIVEDAEKKKAIADIYREGWNKYAKGAGATYAEGIPGQSARRRSWTPPVISPRTSSARRCSSFPASRAAWTICRW
ncbi:nitroreductase family protein [Mycobacteroides abscessus MAB_030201_1075]|uniref:Nitroreductase family protein n=1 Tax=Mycobacteroides abscessus MAB_030201_1075 TaxID=1335410 RepID=A0A829PUP4_9MYCO|nr:nitroreductase family protein [Mycobacteroides abscessus MAB_030201_1075]